MFLSDYEKAHHLYSEVESVRSQEFQKSQRELIRSEIKRMTIHGIVYYGFMLTVLETSTLGAVYLLKLIIDYLKENIHV